MPMRRNLVSLRRATHPRRRLLAPRVFASRPLPAALLSALGELATSPLPPSRVRSPPEFFTQIIHRRLVGPSHLPKQPNHATREVHDPVQIAAITTRSSPLPSFPVYSRRGGGAMVVPLRLIPRLAAAACRLTPAASCAPRLVLRRAPLLPALAMASTYSAGSGAERRPLFRQLFEKESSTYTYLLADVADPDKPAVVSPSSAS